MTIISATEIQNNFAKYLQAAQEGKEIVILKNGKEAARLVPCNQSVSFLTDSLIGVMTHDYSEKQIKSEKMAK